MNTTEIRKLRLDNGGLTQPQMAKLIGVKSATSYGVKERGLVDFKASEIKAIAQRFHMSLEDIDKVFFDNELSSWKREDALN